jgi:hypothetical protein
MVMGHRNVPSAAAIDASLASHAHNTFKPCHFCEHDLTLCKQFRKQLITNKLAAK